MRRERATLRSAEIPRNVNGCRAKASARAAVPILRRGCASDTHRRRYLNLFPPSFLMREELFEGAPGRPFIRCSGLWRSFAHKAAR